ncbi:MAG: Ribosome maturation factor RimP [Bacteroidetes bacterium MED-G17]|nr:MAG: Ribosome maturation factor RimP [Bacteroidetes bacterium MED-G17]
MQESRKGMQIPFFHDHLLMSKVSAIKNIIENQLVDTDCFLVDTESNSTETVIKFFIDGNAGVKIDFCAKLSRTISKELDNLGLEEDAFRFEISSPGIEKPLVDIRQFPQHINRTLRIEQDENIIKGMLKKIDGNNLEIKIPKSKKLPDQIVNIEFNQQIKIKVIPSFK